MIVYVESNLILEVVLQQEQVGPSCFLRRTFMAILGDLLCHDCKVRTCLGKWLREESNEGFGFWRGGLTFEELGLKTLQFLAQHMNHHIGIVTSGEMDRKNFWEYRAVEDDLSTAWPEKAAASPGDPTVLP